MATRDADDDDWESAEADMSLPPSDSVTGLPMGVPLPEIQAAGGLPRPGGPPQQIDPKLVKKWACIYPCYLNPRKKVSEGRRLPLPLLAGCE